jgi:hypothetical protein
MSESVADDLPITVQLPLGSWRIVLAHLELGTYLTVVPVLAAIRAQAAPQVEAAVTANQAKLIEEARNVAEAADAVRSAHPAGEPAKPIDTKALN